MLLNDPSPRRPLRPPPAVLVLAALAPDRSGIARLARELGYRAIEAEDPFDVLRQLRERPALAQLLLVDISLPKMDGGEVVERARDLAPGIRTVFLSSDPDGADAPLIRAYPEQLVLETPVAPAALSAVLRAALGRGSRRPALERRRRPRRSGRYESTGEIGRPRPS